MKVAEKHEDSAAAVADALQEPPKVEKVVADQKRIPEPQENEYAHELHKDERDISDRRIQHDTHHDHDDHENHHDHEEHDEHENHHDHEEVAHPYHEDHDEHGEEHHTDHHEMALRDDPHDHLSHSNLIPRLADKDEGHHVENTDRQGADYERGHHDPEEAHGNKFDLFRRGRDRLRDVIGRERRRDDDLKKHDEKDVVHPHSEHAADHDVFDIIRKKAMDKIRDRDLFQGRPDEGAHEDTDTKAYNEHGDIRHKGSVKRKTPIIFLMSSIGFCEICLYFSSDAEDYGLARNILMNYAPLCRQTYCNILMICS